MAYRLTYFLDMQSQTSEQLLAALLAGLRDGGRSNPNLQEVSRGSDWPQGFDWVAGSLTIGGRDTGIAIEVHTDADLVDRHWSELSGTSQSPPERPATDLATCVLTLTGELDEVTLVAAREWLLEERGAVEHDEHDGFA